MSMDGFRTDPEELRGGASDILKCLDPAKGIDFEALNDNFGDSDQGDVILSGKFEKFCATWQEALLFLGDRAAGAAEKVNDIADNYERSDAAAEQLYPYHAGR
jgi:hypothetical protein